MKKSEYLKKIVDRTEDVLEERGLSDEFTIYWDVDKIDGVKHPIMTIENPYGSETEFDLLSDYNRHEEEDISMSESFRRIKEAIIEYVSEYEEELENDEPYDEEDEEEYDEDEYELEDEESYDDLADASEESFLSILATDNLILKLYDLDYYKRTFCSHPDSEAGLNGIYKPFGDIAITFEIKDMGLHLNQSMKSFYFSDKSIDELIEACIPEINRTTQISAVGSATDIFTINNSSGMLSNEVMENVRSTLGTKDFYIVPSSIDELLAIKKNNLVDLNRLKELLTLANNNYGTDGRKLSSNIFEYDFDSRKPIIAGEPVRETTNEQNQEHTDQPVTQEPSLVPPAFLRPSLEQLSRQHFLVEDEFNNIANIAASEEISADEDPEEDLDDEYEDDLDILIDDDLYDDLDEDEEIHDTNYFAEYDTYSPLEFANTMVELFNYRLGNNFHLSGMDLVDNDNLVRMDMNNANNEYQNNSMDFLEFGDQLTNQYQELKAEALSSEENRSGEENLSEEDEEQDSYPDEYLPF